LYLADPVQDDLSALSQILVDSDLSVDEIPQSAATAVWELSQSDLQRRFFRRCHLVQNRAETTTLVDGRELAEVVRDRYWGDFVDQVSDQYQVFLDLVDRRVLEPFTMAQLARILTAILEGMLHKALVDPDAISAETFSGLVVGIVSTMTAARDDPVTLADLELELGTSTEYGEISWLRRIGVAALPLFDLPNPVRFSAVGQLVGAAPERLAARFGTLRAVAASGIAICLDELHEAAGRFAGVDPERALTDAICVIARTARAHPIPARAVLGERLGITTPPDEDIFDVRTVVDLASPLHPLVRDIWGRAETGTLVELIIDQSLLVAAGRPRLAPAQVASVALRMARARVGTGALDE